MIGVLTTMNTFLQHTREKYKVLALNLNQSGTQIAKLKLILVLLTWHKFNMLAMSIEIEAPKSKYCNRIYCYVCNVIFNCQVTVCCMNGGFLTIYVKKTMH